MKIVPSTRNNAAGPTIAPGAENVGQAQIVSEFSKPFELEGLFGAADAGAFAGRAEMDDMPMGMVDEDGDVFWDAVEGPEGIVNQMDDIENGVPMESDDLRHIIPRKRSRSPSEASNVLRTGTMTTGPEARDIRQPKRQRKSKNVPAYDAPLEEHVLRQMGKSNPLSRRVLKKEAKRARKALRVRRGEGDVERSMDVDDDDLQFTFMG